MDLNFCTLSFIVSKQSLNCLGENVSNLLQILFFSSIKYLCVLCGDLVWISPKGQKPLENNIIVTALPKKFWNIYLLKTHHFCGDLAMFASWNFIWSKSLKSQKTLDYFVTIRVLECWLLHLRQIFNIERLAPKSLA